MASDWYDAEQPTRTAMIAEVQRIRRRTVARPLPVFALALAITALVAYKVATRKPALEAEVVLALTEGSMSGQYVGLPVEELRDYVTTVLLPDAKLEKLIEQRNMYPRRKQLGNQYAIDELRSQIEIKIWKNTFEMEELEDENGHSARIGIDVTDIDPDRAYGLARDLSAIVIETSAEQRARTTKDLANQIGVMRDRLESRLGELSRDMSQMQNLVDRARAGGNQERMQDLALELTQLEQEQKSANKTLGEIAQSRDTVADRISAAGLDVTIGVVEEHKPPPADHGSFVLAMVIFVVGIGAALGAALVLGAFDSRVHDTDDIERLGLAVLGHLPGFPGDDVGSLEARGVSRRRVPSLTRWRWLR